MSDQIPTLGNPFDLSQPGGNQPGLAGQTPDFWRSLALFGGNLAAGANARTAGGFLANGTGLAGPLGAAVGPTMAATTQGAVTRSGLASQAAETQGKLLQNQLTGLQIPFAAQRMRMMTDPALWQQMFGPIEGGAPSGTAPGGVAPSSSTAPTSSDVEGAPSGYAKSVMGIEGGGTNSRSTANGYGQFVDGTWQQFAQENPQYFKGMNTDQIMAARNDPVIAGHATDWLATKNAKPLSDAGVEPNGTTLAMSHFLTPQGTAAIVKAPDDALAGGVLNASLGPRVAGQFIQANPALAVTTAGALKSRYANVPDPSFVGGQSFAPGTAPTNNATVPPQVQPGAGATGLPTGMSAAHARALSAAYGNRAMTKQLLGFDPTPDTTQASQYSDYANKYELQQSEPRTIRGPGSALITPGGVIQSPDVYEMTGPDMRKYRITQNAIDTGVPYVRPAGVPNWAPPGTLSVAMAEPATGETEGMHAAAEDAFGEKARGQYAAAQGTIRTMEQLDHQFDTLNSQGPGWYNTGDGATLKLSIGKALNARAAEVGLPPVFDVNKLAAGEDILKESKLAGMQTLQTFFGGSREAASIVQSTQQAVPNLEGTPLGSKAVLNSVREAARWQADQHVFMTNWSLQHKGNMIGADTAFAYTHPSPMYARRAISSVQPFDVSEKELPNISKRYLPGTRIHPVGAPADVVKVVPGDEDIAPIIPPVQEGANAP